MKKTVLCRGPVLTQSGYGVHARQIARWLLANQNVDVSFQPLQWGDTPWLIDNTKLDGLVAAVMKKSVNPSPESPFDVTIQLQLPNEWDPKLGKFNVGVTAGVETDKCNPEWTVACNKMSMIIVPSEHTKLNLLSQGPLTVPIVVVPEAFSDACLKKADDLPVSSLPTFSTPFNFLIFGQITGNNPFNDRKNTFFTLKWLFETFKDDPDVGIIMKTNAGRNTLIDRNNTMGMIRNVAQEARKGAFPKVHLLHGDMSDNEVAALYVHPQVKALVALTRGEGYGLPILEAAASGLPVIATNWSGHLDFMNHGKFISIYYQLAAVHQSRIDKNIFIPGSRWAEPSEQDFKKRVMKFRTSSTTPKEWAVELQTKLQSMYNFEQISKRYDETFKEVF